jgi:hypothetical protein
MHRRSLLRENLTLLQTLGRLYPNLETLCRERPVAIAPPVLPQGMEPNAEEQLANDLIESAAFLFTLKLGQKWSHTRQLRELLTRGVEQEQTFLQRILDDGQRMFSSLPRPERLGLRYKILQNLTSLQIQAVQTFVQVGFPPVSQEQNLRLGRELLQDTLDRVRQITN